VQPAFNRQFQMLIENLQSYEKRGIRFLFLQNRRNN
jgi:hypothetical protein